MRDGEFLGRDCLKNGRLETLRQYQALNALYDQLWLYYNLFQPAPHQVSKGVVDGKLRRRWDRAQTPDQRGASRASWRFMPRN